MGHGSDIKQLALSVPERSEIYKNACKAFNDTLDKENARHKAALTKIKEKQGAATDAAFLSLQEALAAKKEVMAGLDRNLIVAQEKAANVLYRARKTLEDTERDHAKAKKGAEYVPAGWDRRIKDQKLALKDAEAASVAADRAVEEALADLLASN